MRKIQSISVVSTLYYSSASVEEFCERILNQLKLVNGRYCELILVDDGSPDDSLHKAIRIAKSNSNIKIIELSRNFGHHNAMMAGLENTKGELVFLIDSDLEEEPENLLPFLESMEANQADVVYGIQKQRRGNFWGVIAGKIYYKLFRLFSGINQPDDIVTCRIMKRKYVDSLLEYKERELSIGGVWLLTGFKQVGMYITKHKTSKTTYTPLRQVKTALDAITSFSNIPLYLNFYLGLIIFTISGFLTFYYLIVYFLSLTVPSGFTSNVILASLTLGLIMLSNGINGLYLAKIFAETKQRPRHIIKNIHQFGVK